MCQQIFGNCFVIRSQTKNMIAIFISKVQRFVFEQGMEIAEGLI